MSGPSSSTGTSASQPPFNYFSAYYGSSATINSEASAASSTGTAQVPPLASNSLPPLPDNHSTFATTHPVWWSLLPPAIDTATTILLQNPSIGWLLDRQPGGVWPFSQTVRDIIEALVLAYITDRPHFPPPEGRHYIPSTHQPLLTNVLNM